MRADGSRDRVTSPSGWLSSRHLFGGIGLDRALTAPWFASGEDLGVRDPRFEIFVTKRRGGAVSPCTARCPYRTTAPGARSSS
jgi:hypothetical protein